jgi:hypothetical protein
MLLKVLSQHFLERLIKIINKIQYFSQDTLPELSRHFINAVSVLQWRAVILQMLLFTILSDWP